MKNETKVRVMKPLEEMDMIDDFLFTEIMSDEKDGSEVCRMILSCVLGREVGEIHYTPQRVVPGMSESLHGIRMDAYVTEKGDDSGKGNGDISVYDIEPDNRSAKKEGLPRRSRYYGDLVDVQLLSTGIEYDKLPELITIFILSYDPFGEDALYYEAGSIIKTHPDIPYNDGIRRIFLYVNGKLPDNADEKEKKLMNLLRYIGSSTEANVTDDATKRLNEIVASTKAKKDIGIKYMKSWELAQDYIEQGRAEGREEGREEGRAEGREEGREEGRVEGREEGREEGRKQGREEERANTLAERERAEKAEQRVRELEALLAEKSQT